ncbi:MAG: PepSY domain-containing protein [Actinomycetota bacterium]
MDGKARKGIIAGAAVAAVALSGTGAVVAGSADDQPLTGSTLEKATDAALKHTGGGTVTETEMDDGGYEVEIRRDDGSQVEVNLDTDFNVTGEEADSDADGD